MVGTFTKRLQDAAARGAAGGSRKTVFGFMRRAIWISWLGLGFVGLVALRTCQHEQRENEPVAASTVADVSQDSVALTISSPVQSGDSGEDVVLVQEALIAAGYEVAVDGVFGRETDAAVRAFQSDEGLVVDGVVGEETGTALGVWA